MGIGHALNIQRYPWNRANVYTGQVSRNLLDSRTFIREKLLDTGSSVYTREDIHGILMLKLFKDALFFINNIRIPWTD